MPKTGGSDVRGPPGFATGLYGSALACSVLALLVSVSPAEANPTGGIVTNGSATITSSGSTEDINQSTQRAVINWDSFNIAPNQTTVFNQPSSSSVTLNRVNASNPSQILGALNANGDVVLINPDGVFFGTGSKVDVNGLIATTANISSANFMAGNMNFSTPSNPTASIVNEGTITAKDAGLVGLVAPNVINNGTINAKLGNVNLGSGDTFTMDMYGDGLINVGVSDAVKQQLIQNSGTINAAGGTIQVTAAAGRKVVDSLVTISGQLNAPAAQKKNGEIIISAAGSNGTSETGSSAVEISGTLNASGYGAGQTGGAISVTGDNVTLAPGSVVDASGTASGGKINIGGDLHGQGPLTNAAVTSVASSAQVKANAITSGNGGQVVIWSDQETTVNGSVQAQGGSESGNGGFVETSSHGLLNVSTAVDTSAPHGKGGEWLLDPASLTISTAANLDVTGTTPFAPTGAAATSNLNTTTLDTALNAGTNVTIITGGDSAANAGDITVSNAISTTGAGSLTLSSYHDIIVNAGITLAGGALMLRADNAGSASGGYITIAGAISTNGGNITMGGGTGAITAGSGYAIGSASVDGDTAQAVGVFVNGVAVKAAGGSIIINGQGYNTITNNNSGVQLSGGSISTTGTGTININGTGSGNTNSSGDFGVEVAAAGVISAANGSLSVTGLGGGAGTGANNYGVYTIGTGSTIETTGSGSVSVTGTGGNATGSGDNNYGVYVSSGSITGATGDNVSVTGTGGNSSGNNNYGVYLNGTGVISALGTGTIVVSGSGTGNGNSGNDNGVELDAGTVISSVNGNLSVVGIACGAGTGGTNHGVWMDGTIETAGSGNVSVSGLGGSSGGVNNIGVVVTGSGSAISTLGSGTVTILGTGAGNTNSGGDFGVEVAAAGVISAANGSLSVTGLGGGAGTGANNYGVYTTGTGSTIETTGSGSVSVTGTGGDASGTGGNNYGVYVNNANGIQTTGAGTITAAGTGGANTGGGNDGVVLVGGSIKGASGQNILITGTSGHGSGTYGFSADPTSSVNAAGSGNLTIVTDTDNFGAASTLTTGSGRWLVYSANPANNNDSSLSNNFVRYSCTYGGSCPIFSAAGDGLLYSFTPILTATPSGLSITYGSAVPSLTGYSYTISGYRGSDGSADSINGSLNGSTTYTPTSSVGTYNLNYANGALTSALGYGFSYVNNPSAITVNPAALTITANSFGKTYGTTYSFAGTEFTDTGLVNGNTVSRVSLTSPGAAATATVAGSPYAITASAATGTGLGNYTISYVNGTLTVNPAALTITANSFGKTYGTTYSFAGTEFTDTGLVNGNTVSSVSLTSPGAAATATVAGSPYAITGSAATGTGLGNYTISYVNGNLTVNPAALTITANSFGKTYGAAYTFSGTEFTAAGLVNGNTVSSVSLSSPGAAAAATVAGGPYAITGSAVVGTGSSNYTITYVNGNLTVNPAALIITADSFHKTYGTTYGFAGTEFTDTGLVNGNTVSSVSLTSPGAGATAPVGPYLITPSGAIGTGLSNYSIGYVDSLMIVGSFTIPGTVISTVADGSSGEGGSSSSADAGSGTSDDTRTPHSTSASEVLLNLCLVTAAQDTLSDQSTTMLDLVEISSALAAELPFYKIQTHSFDAAHISCRDSASRDTSP